MAIEYRKTPEERTFDQLVEDEWESLSEAARTVLWKAGRAAYKTYLEHSPSYMPDKYEDDMKTMRLAAAELTDSDCESLTNIWDSALAAAASIDPYDYETPVTCDACCAHLHRYYRMVSSKLEEVEREKRYAEVRKKETSEQGPAVIEDPPSDANIEIS
jgi:hypothetical protein